MPPDRQRVLVVDDDPNVAEVVTRYLEREGYDVTAVGDGAVALRLAQAESPDLVVLDRMLPGLDGFEICRRLRAGGSSMPIVMLTARGEEEERIAGLELGADDYLAKPFSPRELAARVKAVLRRSPPQDAAGPATLMSGPLRVDVVAHEVHVDDRLVALTSKEFDLLTFLMSHPRRAFRREELLEQVWGWTIGDTSTVTVHVRRLREKVEADPGAPLHLQTVWGVGYRFEPQEIA